MQSMHEGYHDISAKKHNTWEVQSNKSSCHCFWDNSRNMRKQNLFLYFFLFQFLSCIKQGCIKLITSCCFLNQRILSNNALRYLWKNKTVVRILGSFSHMDYLRKRMGAQCENNDDRLIRICWDHLLKAVNACDLFLQGRTVVPIALPSMLHYLRLSLLALCFFLWFL